MRIQHALISVSDKTGLDKLAAALKAAGVVIYSTDGTAAVLADAGCEVINVSDLTGSIQLLGGRVKTLHPNVYAAILADTQNPRHMQELTKRQIPKLDLVVVNFYPFEKILSTAIDEEIIENIDIGGPAMARAAAKNYTSTLVLTDPDDYPPFIDSLKSNGFSNDMRRRLATKAFIKVARLDATIANHFSTDETTVYPHHRFLHIKKVTDLAYGENPHQTAACYSLAEEGPGFTQLQGAALSYNNLLDAHSAWMAVACHKAPAAAIIKHNNPCGVAIASTIKKALARAIHTDSASAFGGVVAVNRALDEEAALFLQKSFWEIILAPRFSTAAKSTLAFKKRLRLLVPMLQSTPLQLTSAGNMLLLQKTDEITNHEAVNVVSRRQPSTAEQEDLDFAWRVAAVVKSNAVVLAYAQATVGIGAGQMSRVDSARLACEKATRANLKIAGSVAAADGFFPFVDGVNLLAERGVTAIIQPGGSKNDSDVIAAADAAGMTMVMTGKRHFRH